MARAVAPAGVEVTMLGALGADPAEAAQRRSLIHDGVRDDANVVVADAPTGSAFITVTP